jgi:hypothetical protein
VEPGRWSYMRDGQGSVARFIDAARNDRASLRCEGSTRRVVLELAALAPVPGIAIRTSFGDLAWSAVPLPGGTRVAAGRSASDPGFDWIAFSRGRFRLEGAGIQGVTLPAWAEVARVIEDCRS